MSGPVIAQVSDLHFGADVSDIAESLLADLVAQRPDATVVSGDLTMRARGHQFSQAGAYLRQLPQPLLVVPGNHDIPLYNVARRFASPFERYRQLITVELDPVLHIAGATLLGLTSMPHWRWKAGHVSERQANLVRTTLGQAPDGAVRVLVTHHPVLPKELSGLIGRSSLVAAAADAGVDLLLSGHTHDPQIARVKLSSPHTSRQALSLVAGTAVSERTRGSLNCYFLVEVQPEQLLVRERQWAGDGAWVEGMSARFERHPSPGPS
jgi:3',5'-cyclic AMP phosphodiesterase CpdA